jgi:hypothetical protein
MMSSQLIDGQTCVLYLRKEIRDFRSTNLLEPLHACQVSDAGRLRNDACRLRRTF